MPPLPPPGPREPRRRGRSRVTMTRVTQANVRPIFVRLALVGLSSESGSLHAAADFGAHFAKVFASVALAVTGTVAAPAVGRAAREQAVGVALVAGNFAARVTFHVGSPSLVSELDLEALADAGDEPTRRIPVAREDGPTWKGAAVRIVDVEQDCRRFVLLKPLDDFLTWQGVLVWIGGGIGKNVDDCI